MAEHAEIARKRLEKERGTGPWFPLGWREATSQWWSCNSPTLAEQSVLKLVPYLREATASGVDLPSTVAATSGGPADPYGNRLWRKTLVPLAGPGDRFLNEYSIERAGEDVENNLVVVHGYGAGLGFFYKNFEPLSRLKGWRLYALDMLGMGNSARPNFRIHAKDKNGKIDEAENWFIDSLEEWRKARDLEKFTLMGHSLGGYMAVSYALKYPGRLNKLILVSPVGIPENPWAVNEAMPEPGDSTMANEVFQDQESIVHDETRNPTATKQTTGANANGVPKRPIPPWVAYLWDANISPFSIVRFAGPMGPRFVSGWTSRRFNHLPETEAKMLHHYSFSIFRQKGSGEYVLPYILAPGAYARRPLIYRIQDVGRRELPDGSRETGIPVVMMYGENDWMDVAGGFAAEEKFKQVRTAVLEKATDEERERENGSAKVVVVSKAGHHLYLDNPDEFNDAIIKEMEEMQGTES